MICDSEHAGRSTPHAAVEEAWDSLPSRVMTHEEAFTRGWRLGLNRAAAIANSAKVREDSRNTKASVQVSIVLAIEKEASEINP